jgi:hypothetical protein
MGLSFKRALIGRPHYTIAVAAVPRFARSIGLSAAYLQAPENAM